VAKPKPKLQESLLQAQQQQQPLRLPSLPSVLEQRRPRLPMAEAQGKVWQKALLRLLCQLKTSGKKYNNQQCIGLTKT